MRKIISLFMVFIIAVTLAGCGAESHALEGKYRCDDWENLSAEIMDFKKDGTFLSYLEDDGMTADGTYEYDNGSYTITVSGLGMKLTGTMRVEGDNLIVQYGQNDPLTFKKMQ